MGSLDRGLAILRLFARRGDLAPLEVAAELELSKSAAYRLISTLVEEGFLEARPGSSALRLGPSAAEVGMAAVSELDVVRVAPDLMRELAASCAETAFLAVPDGDSMVYVHRENGPQAVTLSSQIGSRRPLHSTGLGKAYLSGLPAAAQQDIVGRIDLVRFTENTITDAPRLLEELSASQERGYAVDNVEGEAGVACFAAPIRDHHGLPVAAISLAGPADRVLHSEERIAGRVAATAAEISRRLGYSRAGSDEPGAVQA
jgi:IclR family acetate operon transcriptional repressor